MEEGITDFIVSSFILTKSSLGIHGFSKKSAIPISKLSPYAYDFLRMP